MNRTLVNALKPLALALKSVIGPRRYRQFRTWFIPSDRFDEVFIVWRAIGKARADNGVMLDVGGHHGESAELFAELGWRVHCFEPNPANWPIIQARISARYPKVELYRVALGETKESGRTFYTSPMSSGISSLHDFHDSHSPEYLVDVVTLAEHCAAEGIVHVDFLKIDTEGYDFFVLMGMDWERVQPDVIVCEFEDRKTASLGYSVADMGDYLVERGYRVIVSEWKPIVRYGEHHDWLCYADFPCALRDSNAWGNLIAIRDRSVEEKVLRELEKITPGVLSPARGREA
jgi:FkbM family methyltransferase